MSHAPSAPVPTLIRPVRGLLPAPAVVHLSPVGDRYRRQPARARLQTMLRFRYRGSLRS